MSTFIHRPAPRLAALALVGLILLASGAARADWFTSKIEQRIAAYVELFNAGDGPGVAALYARDAVVLPPNGDPVEGREAIAAFWGGFFGAMSDVEIQLTTTAAERNGTLGHSRGGYVLGFTPPEGESVTDRGKYVVVWKRGPNGGWELAVDVWNTSLPPAGP